MHVCRRGTAAVEFAIISLVMVLVCIAILDVGRALLLRNELAYAADHAARVIMRLGECSEAEAEVDADVGRNFRENADAVEIRLSSEVEPPLTYCTVTLRLSLRPIVPGLLGQTINLSAHRRVPLV
jgi:xanthosine utilization system XapX-like protein